MLAKSRTSCKACARAQVKCDRKRPSCKQCVEHGSRCKYELVLQWGGRPYRDMSKRMKIPKGLVMEDGVLKAKIQHKPKGSYNIDQLVLVKEQFEEEEQESHSLDAPSTCDLDESEVMDWNFQSIESPILARAPAMEFLLSSPQYWNFLEFFINRTSQVLVAITIEDSTGNPFTTTVPQMAMSSLMLTKMLVAFGAQHKHQLLKRQRQSQSQWLLGEALSNDIEENVSRSLLGQAVQELLEKMVHAKKHVDERDGELMLASTLMLAGYSIFFGNSSMKWSSHLRGARDILTAMLSPQKQHPDSVIMNYTSERGSRSFLQRWFAYITTMGLLSSAPLAYSDELTVNFSAFQRNPNALARIGSFDSVEYNGGMETEVLEMLTRVGLLVMKCEKLGTSSIGGTLLADAIELDYEITRYQSEKEREMLSNEVSESDRLLRATSQLFGFSGMLQLRRRVMKIPANRRMVKELVLQAAQVLETLIPAESTALCSLTSCIFTCGCECIDSELVYLQPLYASRLERIVELGMSSTEQAKSLMEECWRTGNSWWEISKARGLDLSFGL